MIHVLRATSSGFVKRSNLCELHGMDFIMDENLNVWYIESNPTPMLTAPTKKKRKTFAIIVKRLL